MIHAGFSQLGKPVVVNVQSSKVAQMLGFYVLLEDPDANVIIIALHCCSGDFLKVMTYAILLISPGRWQQANTQQPIGVVGLVIIHVNVCYASDAYKQKHSHISK